MSDYRLSIDFVMIIGKYFKKESDYINIVKVCKKYNELLLMYKYNPISNCDLFPNIETQHFYLYSDIFYRKRRMFRYIYWIQPFLLYDYFNMIDTSLCVIKNIYSNKFINFCKDMNFKVKNIFFNNLSENLKRVKNGYLIFNYNNKFFGIIIEDNIFNYPKSFKQKYFIGRRIYNCECDLFISQIDKGNRFYLRDRIFNDILTIYVNKKELKNIINQEYPIIEVGNKDFLIRFPDLMNITEFCIVEN